MACPNSAAITPEQGLLELSLRSAEEAERTFDDVVIDGIRSGLPPEVVTRLQALWDETRVIAGEVVAIGRIVVQEVMAFLKANPAMTVGMALGAATGLLVAAVPLLGPLLAPIAAVLAGLYGAGIGATAQGGKNASASPVAAAMELARKFFELFIAIMNAVSKYWESR